jgi:hypothetical protein
VAAGGGGFTPTSTESSNFLARATGITSDVDKGRYDTLITGLVTDGIFSKLDALYIFAAPDSATALLNLIQNYFNGTVTGALTFNAYVGYTGSGATNYINTGFNPSTAGGNYLQNSGSLGAYVRTSRTADQTYTSLGTQTGAGYSVILPQGVFGDTFQYAVNSGTPKSVASTNSQGQWIASGTGASAIAAQKNGAAFDSDTGASVSRDNSNIYVFATNAGSPSNFSLDQQSAVLIGGGLTGTEMTNLAGRINAFMTAYGINVY